MDVLEATRQLGKAIQADARYEAFTADQDKIKEYNDELKRVYGLVMTNPNMIAYNEAKSAMDQLLAEVNDLVTQCVNGEDPDTVQPSAGCTGSCATCGGCH